jgi:SAM-dependent methyltransferase
MANDEGAPAAKGSTREEEAARRRGMLARVAIRTRAHAELVFPAAPSLVGHYIDILADHFAALGRPFSGPDLEKLRRILRDKLVEAFEASPTSSVVVRYDNADDGTLRIDYGVAAATSTLAAQYEHWVQSREPPLFGAHPDAKVTSVAEALASGARVVDIGAGTGRNSLALARRGFSVDAIEPAPALADVLEAEAAKEGLPVRVARADVLTGALPVPEGCAALVIASQVTSHFRVAADLRPFLRAVALALAPGGQALITIFLARSWYHPDRTARELGQVFWTTFFTPEELREALSGLPLATVSEESALEHERRGRPADAWPPTGWYEAWARGEDVFGRQANPPIELRWLHLRREGGAVPPA